MIQAFAGVSAYAAMWIAALIAVICLAPVAGRQIGVPPRRILPATLILILAAMAGSKLYWIVETGRSLDDAGGLWLGHRGPGALLGGIAALPLATRFFRLPSAAALGDALAPAFCIALAAVRIGCFLNGCCCGRSCELPWAVRFPAGSDAWTYQVFERELLPSATISAPVHPLQLYLALAGVLIGVIGFAALARRRFQGQVLLGCVAAWAATEASFYGLRYQYSAGTHVVVALIAVVATTGMAALFQLRRGVEVDDAGGVRLLG